MPNNLPENNLSRASLKSKKSFWSKIGPGITTGAADDDPSGIATYSQAGARYGFQLLWLSLFTLPLMALVQEMCARIGMVTGRGLADNIRLHYSRWSLYFCVFLLFVANSFNIGADLGVMAKSLQLIFPNTSFIWTVVVFAIISLLLQVYLSYGFYAKYLKYLTISLLAYVFVGFIVGVDWSLAFRFTFWPAFDFSKDQIFLICGILGTTISPYLFFWQTSQEVEEEILDGKETIVRRKGVSRRDLSAMRWDIWLGMFFSNLVMFFIIAACAATLFSSGLTNINSAEEAALALQPIAGKWAFLLFTLGILGTGFLAIPVLAGSAAYAVAESFRWKEGLYLKFKEAYSFYFVIIFSVLVGLALNFLEIDSIQALIYSAVLNGLISPVMLFFIVAISGNKKIMGGWTNRILTSVFGWLIVLIMGLVSLSVLISLLI